ncbi:MAG TPA: malto-oligosyltrehalose trehalohydrolase [Solirubrobacteraceae bacterium]|jgi:maltooligosyltrehalose trehalohydrolase|nr:malto-oligosyltrehalose trehalohydrolase [Solirubrobacteraceae bacterium]
MTPEPLPWERRLGATPAEDSLVEFRVWALNAADGGVRVRVGGREHALTDAGHGVFEGRVQARAGEDYVYVVGDDELPDPCSRHQPQGLRGPSRIVDPRAFAWTDERFAPRPLAEQVIYELHVGTFTAEGTFDAAIEHLPELARLGVTSIEVMPVAEFPGAHGWGYDGVYLSAAQSTYGGPDGFQRLVDAAHRNGLGVILDVVYNHVGASGNQALAAFGPYFTDRYSTFWGNAMNYDDEHADPVREWVLQSAEGWLRDFHVDGLRLDAIHAVYDTSANPILAVLAQRVHAARPGALVIAESGLNDPKVIRPRELGGFGHDAQWADDFHHALRVLLTGDTDGWYAEFGRVADLAKAYERPFVHDGGYSAFRKRRFGAPAGDRPPEQFVVFDQNHDQVGNRALGDRLPDEARALAAFCTLLSPYVPMLFMGEEYGEQAPFQFFSDHIDEEIATATREGRRREFAAFARFAGEEVPDPQDRATFERSKLTRVRDPQIADLYADLLLARARLPSTDAVVTDHDEDDRWLTVDRGPFRLCANFAGRPREVPLDGHSKIVLATGSAEPHAGHVLLAPMTGALLK